MNQDEKIENIEIERSIPFCLGTLLFLIKVLLIYQFWGILLAGIFFTFLSISTVLDSYFQKVVVYGLLYGATYQYSSAICLIFLNILPAFLLEFLSFSVQHVHSAQQVYFNILKIFRPTRLLGTPEY